MTAAHDSLKEQTARVVSNPQCSVDCPTGCSHLMWVCAQCACEGGWGGERGWLQQIADEHSCPREQTPYTPTTDQIRNNAAFGVACSMGLPAYAADLDWPEPGLRLRAKASFDAWLAANEQKVRAEAWDECLDEIERYEINTEQARAGNPHRIKDGYGD